jgi:hypothetical protein
MLFSHEYIGLCLRGKRRSCGAQKVLNDGNGPLSWTMTRPRHAGHRGSGLGQKSRRKDIGAVGCLAAV